MELEHKCNLVHWNIRKTDQKNRRVLMTSHATSHATRQADDNQSPTGKQIFVLSGNTAPVNQPKRRMQRRNQWESD